MLVNARSSNHEPNQEPDNDLKRLSERDALLCEQALYFFPQKLPYLFSP